MIEWNYTSLDSKSNGYEQVIDYLKQFDKAFYNSCSEQEKELVINKIFNIYRTINIFPILYFNEDGIKDEILKCYNKDIVWDGKALDMKYTQGSSLCRFLFPNLYDVECKGQRNNSPYYKFYDDHKLKRAIKLALEIKNGVTPSEIRTSLELIGGNVATNFPPMKAKALYERYCPVGGSVYDFSCGFGGRLLGCLSSKNNYKYFGVEPCSETFDNLNNLGRLVESALGRSKCFYILKCGSECIKVKKEFADFAFSSPPYFNLEVYSKEDTQCYNKYPELESWFRGYVEPTIKNIYNALKPNRYYAVNIADFKVGQKNIKYVDRWIQISKDIGFEFIEEIPMKLQLRRGDGNTGEEEKKSEGIYVFKKIGNIDEDFNSLPPIDKKQPQEPEQIKFEI